MAKDKDRDRFSFDEMVPTKKKQKDEREQPVNETVVNVKKNVSMNYSFDSLINGFKGEIRKEKEVKELNQKFKADNNKENSQDDKGKNVIKKDNNKDKDKDKDKQKQDDGLDSVERERAYHEHLLRYYYDHDLDTIPDIIEDEREEDTLFHEFEDQNGDGVKDIDEYEQDRDDREKDDDDFYEEYFERRIGG